MPLAWQLLDNTYEDFVYDGRHHHAVDAPHVINIFSFSKAYGMMGWRVGYLAFTDSQPGGWSLENELLKAQDSIPICPPVLSQQVALAALESAGCCWVRQNIADTILPNRDSAKAALEEALGAQAVRGGDGGIYLLITLPPQITDDLAVAGQLASQFGVLVIPGSACGAPGTIRVAYGNLRPAECAAAVDRLVAGLQQIAAAATSKQSPQ